MVENQHSEDVRITRSLERRYGVTHNQARASLHEFRRLDRALKSVEGLVPGVSKTQPPSPSITITETKTGSSEVQPQQAAAGGSPAVPAPPSTEVVVTGSLNGAPAYISALCSGEPTLL